MSVSISSESSASPVPESAMSEAAAVLREVFGFEQFRGLQADIIETLIAGEHSLVLMPTGGGKSLCYQIPALVRPGTGVVISPLIALMRDQVEALRANGVRAEVLNSSLSTEHQVRVEAAFRAGQIDLLYIAPERLMQSRTIHLLQQTDLSLLAIDEAHCVSQWGHDFRPEYLQLGKLAQHFPKVPRVALTATADTRTREEINRALFAGQSRLFIASFDRPNIRYRVQTRDNARRQLLEFIQREHATDAGIVYCLSRKRAEQVASWLSDAGHDALPYHAGLDNETRQRHQDRFIREEGLIIVATVAFGMGIDKPDVRFVVHLDLPRSIEAYYQETGRAGRDGLPSDAWMIYGLEDVYRLRQLLTDSDRSVELQMQDRQRLEALLAYCEQAECRRPALLGYFGEQYEAPCGNCDRCLSPPKTEDASETARMALSCVYRTGQRFGASHLVDVLTGSKTARIESLGHDRISTFGIGKNQSKNYWRALLRQLLAKGLLAVDPEGYGGLRLDPSCRELLRGEAEFVMRSEPKRVVSSTPGRRASSIELSEADQPLFDQLRAVRMELARTQGVPPYVIFHDATLKSMLDARPSSMTELANVHGVGKHKLQKYGEAFLDVLLEADLKAKS
ncbi:MAG: DNA helicase RecQ [Pseudomonadota bacterium]